MDHNQKLTGFENIELDQSQCSETYFLNQNNLETKSNKKTIMLQMDKEEKTVSEKVGFLLKSLISAAGTQIYDIVANKVTPKINQGAAILYQKVSNNISNLINEHKENQNIPETNIQNEDNKISNIPEFIIVMPEEIINSDPLTQMKFIEENETDEVKFLRFKTTFKQQYVKFTNQQSLANLKDSLGSSSNEPEPDCDLDKYSDVSDSRYQINHGNFHIGESDDTGRGFLMISVEDFNKMKDISENPQFDVLKKQQSQKEEEKQDNILQKPQELPKNATTIRLYPFLPNLQNKEQIIFDLKNIELKQYQQQEIAKQKKQEEQKEELENKLNQVNQVEKFAPLQPIAEVQKLKLQEKQVYQEQVYEEVYVEY